MNVFDPRTATWATGVPLPEPISFVRAVSLSNSILILGPTADGGTTKLLELPFSLD